MSLQTKDSGLNKTAREEIPSERGRPAPLQSPDGSEEHQAWEKIPTTQGMPSRDFIFSELTERNLIRQAPVVYK